MKSETWRTRFLGVLLRHANRDPIGKERFYKLKKRLLEDYGHPDGPEFGGRDIDWQDCSRVCWSCSGTGEARYYDECSRCGGTGVYREVYVPLHRWRLGGRVFHIPGDPQPDEPEGGCQIIGHIQHPPTRWAWISELVLGLLFDRHLARECLSVTRPALWFRRFYIIVYPLIPCRCPRCGKIQRRSWSQALCDQCDAEEMETF